MLPLMAAGDLEIAHGITTPIALAALCLLLIAGVLKAIVRGPAGKDASQAKRLIIHYGFVLAITLSVLANTSYLIIAMFQREVRISGTIRDNGGSGLNGAVIDIPGSGRGITDDHGTFQFVIPDVWSANDYEAVISLKGYRSERIKLSGKRPRPIDVTLEPLILTSETLINVKGDILVRHTLGVPVVEIPLDLTDPLGRNITIDQVSLELDGPADRHLRLWPQSIHVGNSPTVPPAIPLTLTPSQDWGFSWIFTAPPDASLTQMAQMADSEFTLSSAHPFYPNPTHLIYSSETTQALQNYMKSHFTWAAGKWTLTVVCSIAGSEFRRAFSFQLPDADVHRMAAIADLYGSGIGVLNPFMYWASDTVNPTAVVKLQSP